MATASLKLDKSLLEEAKKFAEDRNMSLSKLVETYLRSIVKKEGVVENQSVSVVDKLYGSITLPADFDYKKELSDALSSKYL